jgi:hypothetical protein
MAKKATTRIKGKTPVSKARIKRQAVASGDQAPETKSGTRAQQEAAEKLFQGADGAMRTEGQHENYVRRQALGY